MQLYLIRHAESGNNARPTYDRIEDPSITRVGRMQAEHLGEWLKTVRIDALITSPFRRTLETTYSALQARSRDVLVWDSVFERGGCYRGWNSTNVAGADGLGRTAIVNELSKVGGTIEVDDSITESGWWNSRPRETDEEVLERTRLVADRLVREFATNDSSSNAADKKPNDGSGVGPVVVMITHADFKRLLLSRLLGGQANALKFGPLRNTGVTRLNYGGGIWQLDVLNSITHLPERLITGKEH